MRLQREVDSRARPDVAAGAALALLLMVGEVQRSWEFVVASPRSAPGVTSMVGYRALQVLRRCIAACRHRC